MGQYCPEVTIGLVQINNSVSGQNHIPYPVALLQSYIAARTSEVERYRFLPLLYKREPNQAAVDREESKRVSRRSPLEQEFAPHRSATPINRSTGDQ